MGKVKNVIKGYCSKEHIERLTIIDISCDEIALFSGPYDLYKAPGDMMEYKMKLDKMEVIKSAVNCGRQLFVIVDNKIKFRRENIMEFLEKLDAETLKTELLAFLDVGEENVEITTLGEFEEQFVEYIKDDFSRSEG